MHDGYFYFIVRLSKKSFFDSVRNTKVREGYVRFESHQRVVDAVRKRSLTFARECNPPKCIWQPLARS